MKRVAAGKKGKKGVSPPVRKAKVEAVDELSEDATVEEIHEANVNVSLTELEEQVADTHDCWETDSIFEDVIDDLEENDDDDGVDVCTPEESCRLRRELREHGPVVFCQRTVDAGRYTAQKLLSAFGIRTPAFLDGQPDEAYFGLLSLALTRELSKRAKLYQHNTVDDAVNLIDKCDNIIVITGAGISTSLGIPDFRTKGSGLYSRLGHLGLNDPQEVFDIEVFRQDPTIFYSVAKDIIPAEDRYTPTHKFLAMLNERGKLLTNYSQNIDNLEVKAGLPKEKLIQCHGSFGTASGVKCGFQIQGEKIFPDIKAGKIPKCTKCVQSLRPAGATKRKRSTGADKKRRRWSDESSGDDNDDDYDIPSAGVMKPDITFFGEALPDEFSKRLTEHDRDKVDLVIVIGTSLKVTPVSEIVSWLPSHIPQIYVSRQPVNHINFDIDLLGDCDIVVTELCRRLKWPLIHEMVPPKQKIDVFTEEGQSSRHLFKARESDKKA